MLQLESQEYGIDDEDDEYGGYIAEEEGEYEVLADLLHGDGKAKSKESVYLAAAVVRRCVEYAEKYENGEKKE